MANDLTGDFNVVAEFPIPTVTRVLAAMHRAGRFPHSLSLLVDDNPKPLHVGLHDVGFADRLIRVRVDPFGNALAEPSRLAQTPSPRGLIGASDPALSQVDPLVNSGSVGRVIGRGDHSHLKGMAQLQLSAPRMNVPDDSGTNVTVRMQMMARYFPDPDTRSMPEFVRGEIQITANVDQVASQVGNVVDIDVKADKVNINFSPVFSDRALSAADEKAINLVIRNALRTGFQPSNSPLPPGQNMLFKTFQTPQGSPDAVGVLLNMGGGSGDPGGANNVFLQDGDDFAIAVGRDFLLGTFASFVNQFQGQQFTIKTTVKISFAWFKVSEFDIVYTISLDRLTIDLQDGQILLTIEGHGHTGSVLPDINFRATQAVTLSLLGATAELAPLGDVVADVSTTGNAASQLAGLFIGIKNLAKTAVTNAMRQRRDDFLNPSGPVQQRVRDQLNADSNLGTSLNSLMNPVVIHLRGQPLPERVEAQLAYTGFEIKSSGVILHGSLEVPAWPPAHAEFELHPFTQGKDTSQEFNALNSWIPGGTIQEFVWTHRGNPRPVLTSQNKFIYSSASGTDRKTQLAPFGIHLLEALGQTPEAPAHSPRDGRFAAQVDFSPICLTVRGSRVSASGPVVEEPVSATVCAHTLFDLGALKGAHLTPGKSLPDVALTRLNASGALEVEGHLSPWAPGGAANLIVHLPDEKSAKDLGFLAQAVRESKRTDVAVAILVVVPSDQLTRIKPPEGLLFSEDHHSAWEHLLRVKDRPATLLVNPRGDVLWRHEGELASGELAAALKTYLVGGGVFSPGLQQLSVGIGQPPPNFLFEYAPGRELTLRKLMGRPVVLVFWKSTSQPSLETLRKLLKTVGEAGGRGPVLLAINDGEAAEVAKKAAAENGLSANVVTDPARAISLAYGVNSWPTTVFIDALGLIRNLGFGPFSAEQVPYPSPPETAPAQSPGNKYGTSSRKTEKSETERPREAGRTPKE